MSQNVLSIDWDCFFKLSMLSCGSQLVCSWSCPDCSKTNARPVPSEDASDTALPAWYFSYGHTPVDAIKNLNLVAADFYVAECHADIWPILSEKDKIVNLDSHDDCGFSFRWEDYLDQQWQDTIQCGDWAEAAELVKECKYYWAVPMVNHVGFISGAKNWRRWRYHKVFVCQSCPWTPSSFDSQFYEFLIALAKLTGRSPKFLGPAKRRLQRKFRRLSHRMANI